MNKKTFSPKQKVTVALAAIKGDKTFSEISSTYQVHPTQIRKWKKITEAGLPSLFTNKRKKKELEKDELIEELYKIIGKHNIELEWLKKKLCIIDVE
jgi:transposase